MAVWVDIVKPSLAALLLKPQEEEYTHSFYSFEDTTRDAIVVLDLNMQQSQTNFSLVFPAALYLKHLLILARDGMLWIVPGERQPDREKDDHPGLLIKLDQGATTALANWLNAWREQCFDA